MSDSLSWNKIDTLHRVQAMADDVLIGDSRYTEVTLWDDGDFRVIVDHGFESKKGNPDEHHGERVFYKESRDDVRYQIYLMKAQAGTEILREKVIAEVI